MRMKNENSYPYIELLKLVIDKEIIKIIEKTH